MAEITQEILNILSFAWGPLFLLAAIAFIASYMNPDPIKKLLERLSLIADVTKNSNIKNILKDLELGYLIPVFVIIVLLALFQFINGPLNAFAQKIPPYLSYIPGVVAKNISLPEERCILEKSTPFANGFDEAYTIATQKIDQSKIYDRVSTKYMFFSYIKLMGLFTIVYILIYLRHSSLKLKFVKRFILIMTTLGVIGTVNIVLIIRAEEQRIYSDWRLVKQGIDNEQVEDWKHQCKEEISNVSEHRKRNWWSLELYDEHGVQWFIRNFISKTET